MSTRASSKHPSNNSHSADGPSTSKKKKIENEGGGNNRKVLRKELTVEEILSLRSMHASNHSSLFHHSLNSMINQVKVDEDTTESILDWVDQLKQFLLNARPDERIRIAMDEHFKLPGKVKFPVSQNPLNDGGVFEYKPPVSIHLVGSFAIDCAINDCVEVDLRVTMPKELFGSKDLKNEKYLRKRAMYASCVASLFNKEEGKSIVALNELRFGVAESSDKPYLIAKPSERFEFQHPVVAHLRFVPEEGTFDKAKIAPYVGNVDSSWYHQISDSASGGGHRVMTPFYNAVLGQDFAIAENDRLRLETFEKKDNLKRALLALKIWLKQRDLLKGTCGFGTYLLSMIMVYLRQKNRLNELSTPYQIMRAVWLFLANEKDWTSEALGLSDEQPVKRTDFTTAYNHSFIDCTGYVNLFALVHCQVHSRLSREAKLALQYVDESSRSPHFFDNLFLTKKEAISSYDHIIELPEHLLHWPETATSDLFQYDYRSDYLIWFEIVLDSMVRNHTFGRILQATTMLVRDNEILSTVEWPVRGVRCRPDVRIGISINGDTVNRVIDRGPVPTDARMGRYRYMWGELSELRRFADGEICESVEWEKPDSSIKARRHCARKLMLHALRNVMQIPHFARFTYISDEIERALDNVSFDNENNGNKKYGTGEEASLTAIGSFEKLGRILKEVTEEDMSLPIASVRGTHPCLRFCDVFPPLPQMKLKPTVVSCLPVEQVERTYVSAYLRPIHGVINVVPSNRWPSELDAIRSLKKAWLMKLANLLAHKAQLSTVVTGNHIDVFLDGYMFRLRLWYEGEVAALMRTVNPEGLIAYTPENKEAIRLRKKLQELPTLNGALLGLHRQYPSFGPTVCLAKRWMRAQMLDESHFGDEALELLVASLFVHPAPYEVASTPLPMICRLWFMLAYVDWSDEFAYVNFNNELTEQDFAQVETTMLDNRKKLSPLVIVTPFDREGCFWTKEQPIPLVLYHAKKLAKCALDNCFPALKSKLCIKGLFQPNLDMFDVQLRIFPECNPTCYQVPEASRGYNTHPRVPYRAGRNRRGSAAVPFIGAHPICKLVQDLRTDYGDKFEFFYNSYGGLVIGMMVKPQETQPQAEDDKRDSENCTGQKVTSKGPPPVNMESILQDIAVMCEHNLSTISVKPKIAAKFNLDVKRPGSIYKKARLEPAV